MLRRLFIIAPALSLLLCVATIALWVRSYSVADRYSGRDTEVTISYWLLTALAGTLPGLRLLAWYRHAARRPIGHCRTCGYDLRGSTLRCPECGAAIIKTGAKE
jgi:drug/metabolite transporter (DMT)-like permease